MSRLQKLLLLFIAFECVQLGFLAWRHARTLPRPRVNFCFYHDSVHDEMRAVVDNAELDGPRGWLRLAEFFRVQGLYPAANYCYRTADALHPNNPDYLYHWAHNQHQMGRLEESIRLYERAIASGTAYPDNCKLWIGHNYLRSDDLQNAEAYLLKSTNSLAKLRLARIYIRRGRAARAAEMLDELINRHPNSQMAVQLRSWAAAALGDHTTAQEFADQLPRRQVQEIYPEDEITKRVDVETKNDFGATKLIDSAAILVEQRRLQEALALNRRAYDLNATTIAALDLAHVHILLGNSREAVKVLEEFARIGGWDGVTLNLLGDALSRSGDEYNAREAWIRSARFFIGGKAIHRDMAILYDKIARSFQMANDDSNRQQYAALAEYERGKNLWVQDKVVQAKTEFDRSVKTWDQHDHAWFYLGETRRLTGDADGAERAYRKCLDINPGHGRSIRALKRLQTPKSADQ